MVCTGGWTVCAAMAFRRMDAVCRGSVCREVSRRGVGVCGGVAGTGCGGWCSKVDGGGAGEGPAGDKRRSWRGVLRIICSAGGLCALLGDGCNSRRSTREFGGAWSGGSDSTGPGRERRPWQSIPSPPCVNWPLTPWGTAQRHRTPRHPPSASLEDISQNRLGWKTPLGSPNPTFEPPPVVKHVQL